MSRHSNVTSEYVQRRTMLLQWAQVAQRFYNSHAVANAALSFRRSAPDGALSDVRVALGRFDTPDTGQRPWGAL